MLLHACGRIASAADQPCFELNSWCNEVHWSCMLCLKSTGVNVVNGYLVNVNFNLFFNGIDGYSCRYCWRNSRFSNIATLDANTFSIIRRRHFFVESVFLNDPLFAKPNSKDFIEESGVVCQIRFAAVLFLRGPRRCLRVHTWAQCMKFGCRFDGCDVNLLINKNCPFTAAQSAMTEWCTHN